ncbi:MAG: zinc ribbon domain-containing protein [Candidatus Heimdallarchaeota archaeon]
MNNSFDPLEHISGMIVIRGRCYSSKEVIRGLLELGININENSEGLKIGFKHFSPQPVSPQSLANETPPNCPFGPYMANITTQLNEISAQLESTPKPAVNTTPNYTFASETPTGSPPSSSSPSSSFFSPFGAVPFQAPKTHDKERFFSNSFLEERQKCSSCGATLPQNAFFCNKCGTHTRTG